MSTKQTEALKLALEALEDYRRSDDDRVSVAMGILQEALAEQPAQQQEPVAVTRLEDGYIKIDYLADPFPVGPLYAAPLQSAQPEQEPAAWMPIEQMYPQGKAIDILMGDGSILCAVLPQFDGDLWWEGSGTGEKFIDPKYANVTHWRVHDEHTSPQPAQQEEPYEIDWPNYNEQAMGCGLEDRGEHCRYGAMRYGWDCAIEAVAQSIPDVIYTSPQPAQPSKPWVGLTEEEIDALYEAHHDQYGECETPGFGYERAIEAKLREKNA